MTNAQVYERDALIAKLRRAGYSVPSNSKPQYLSMLKRMMESEREMLREFRKDLEGVL